MVSWIRWKWEVEKKRARSNSSTSFFLFLFASLVHFVVFFIYVYTRVLLRAREKTSIRGSDPPSSTCRAVADTFKITLLC